MKIRKISLIILSIAIIVSMSIKSLAIDDNDISNDNADNNLENNVDNNIDNDNNNNDNQNNIDQEENKPNDEPDNKPEEPSNSGNNSNPSGEKNTEVKPPKNNNQNNNSNYNEEDDETKSDNTNLKSLKVDVEGLSPEFDKNITEYYLIVDLTIEEVNVEAVPEDEKSKITITGNSDLQEGENTVKILVKAENGNTKTYTINITKTNDLEKVNATLKSLSVKGFNFYPSFKTNIYNYNLTVNEKLTQLEILAETEIEEATYEIIGNENLTEGNNLIKIIVTAKDGETKREYKINVYLSNKSVEAQKTNMTIAIVMLSVLSIAIVATVVLIIKKRK